MRLEHSTSETGNCALARNRLSGKELASTRPDGLRREFVVSEHLADFYVVIKSGPSNDFADQFPRTLPVKHRAPGRGVAFNRTAIGKCARLRLVDFVPVRLKNSRNPLSSSRPRSPYRTIMVRAPSFLPRVTWISARGPHGSG